MWQVRSEIDLKLILTERARARACAWEPPLKGAEIEVEVEDEHTPQGPEWRRAKVTRVCPDLSIEATIVRPDGKLDTQFVEEYSRMEEGTEWRRV